jgi:autotransporter translocation and assembly factor TamB
VSAPVPMKRLVLGVGLLVLCGAAALLWFGWPYLTERIRQRLEQELAAALGPQMGARSRIAELTVSVVPPGVHVGGLVIGAEPALATVASIDARLWALASLAEGRPVISARITAPAVDLSHLPQAEPGQSPKQRGAGLPPVHVRKLEVTDAQLLFRMGNTPAKLTVARFAGQMKTGLLRAGMSAGLEASGVELQRKTYRAHIDEIHADGGADAGGLFVNSAQVQGEGIVASVHATTTPHRHAASATFDPGILGVVVDELSFVGGEAQLDGTLDGSLANPVLDGHLAIAHGAIGRRTLGDLDTHVTRTGPTLHFADVRLTGRTGRVDGTVELTIDKEVPIHGDLAWHGVDLEGLLATVGQPVPFTNRFNASTAVNGSLDPLDLGVEASGVLQEGGRESAPEVASWKLGGRIHAHELQAHLEVTQAQGNQASTKIALAGSQLDGTITLQAADLAALNAILPSPVRRLALSGAGQATATLAGSTEHPVVAGTLDLKDLTVVGAPLARLGGDFSIARGALTTKSVQVDAAKGNAELKGSLALDAAAANDWRLTVREIDTDLVLHLLNALVPFDLPLNGGTVNGTLGWRGPWLRPDADADLAVKSLHVFAEPLDRVEVKAAATAPQWTLHGTIVHNANERATIEATGQGSRALQLTLDASPLNLATLRGAGRRRITGTIALHGQLAGEVQRPSGSVQLTASGLGIGGHEIGDVAVQADGRDGEWSVNGSALANSVRLAATVQTAPPLPYTLNISWHDTNLARVIATDQSLQVVTSGECRLTGSLRAPVAPSGTIQVSRFEVQRDLGRIESPEPMRIDVEAGRLHVRSLVLAAQGSQLTVSGDWSTSGGTDLNVRGDADLVLLELFGPPFQAARGQLAVSARIQRLAESGWEVRGQATVRDAALDFGLPVAMTDTNGTFAFAGSKVGIEHLSGRAGGGEFTVAGSIDLNAGPNVSWTLRDVGLALPEWLEERIAGKGQVQGTWKVLTVTGDVEVLNALYDRRLELADLVPWFKEHVAPAPRIAPPVTVVQLDLHVHAPDGLFIDNNFAKAEMKADLRVAGSADKPALTGTVEVLSGEVTFRDRVFRLTGGTIDFHDPYRFNPALNLSAESQISTTEAEYTVFVAVSGTAEEPRVEFSADDPGLSQNDVLSLVTFGKTTAQAQRDSGGVSVGDVLALLPSGATGDVKTRVRTMFGVDRFEVEPAYVRDTGSIEPRVTIGKDLTERIRALGSSSFGTDARRSVQLEYRVTRRVSLLGTWESQTQEQAGAFGGDVKFRYEFRRLPFSLFATDGDATPQANAP